MPVSVGDIVEGFVTGITNFGAFIQLEKNKTGLVHISEISHDYVNNVSDYLKKDQKVKVKVLSVNKDDKISLSIRQAQPKRKTSNPGQADFKQEDSKVKSMSFEDKMAKFLKDSSEKQDQLKKNDPRGGFGAKNRK